MPVEKIKKSDDDNAAAGGDADSWQLHNFYYLPGTTVGALLIWIQSSQHPRHEVPEQAQAGGGGLTCSTLQSGGDWD